MGVSPIVVGRVVVLVFVLVSVSRMVAEGRSGCSMGLTGLHCSTYRPDTGSGKPSPVHEEALKGLRPLDPRDGGDVVNWDLRVVPSGPDPLHHNSSPKNKKPRTP